VLALAFQEREKSTSLQNGFICLKVVVGLAGTGNGGGDVM